MDTKDYYRLLEVERNAGADEIKKAYRNLARRFHPDVNGEDGAEERFKAISEAYDVLSDTEKRRIYDQTGQTQFSANSGPRRRRGPGGFGPCMGRCGGFSSIYARAAKYRHQQNGTRLNSRGRGKIAQPGVN